MEDLISARYPGVFPDLVGGSLLSLDADERLWKLYFLRPAWGRDERVEHRIYTKVQADGRITLVSYNFRMPPGGRPVKNGLAVARDVPEDILNQVVWNVVRQTGIGPEELEVIDLSRYSTFEEQLRYLRSLGEPEPADVVE